MIWSALTGPSPQQQQQQQHAVRISPEANISEEEAKLMQSMGVKAETSNAALSGIGLGAASGLVSGGCCNQPHLLDTMLHVQRQHGC